MEKLSEELPPLKKYVFYVFGLNIKRQKLHCYGLSKDEAYQKVKKIYDSPLLKISYEGEDL